MTASHNIKKDPDAEQNSRDGHVKNHHCSALCDCLFISTQGQNAAGLDPALFCTWLIVAMQWSFLQPLYELLPEATKANYCFTPQECFVFFFFGSTPISPRYNSEHRKGKYKAAQPWSCSSSTQLTQKPCVMPQICGTACSQDAFMILPTDPTDFAQWLLENINEGKAGPWLRQCWTYWILH